MKKEIVCKHHWKSTTLDNDLVILYCAKCGLIRKCYKDGYIEFENSKGIYKEEKGE